MSVKISNVTFDDSEYNRHDGIYKAKTLYQFAKMMNYPIQDLPLWCIDLTLEPFECTKLGDFLLQVKRINNCSLDYPIILDDKGVIADGYHRVCKAILEGKDTIKAIRLEQMPPPDYKVD